LLPDDYIYLTVYAENSDGKHSEKSRFLFKGNKLLAKEESKYAGQDFSTLISRWELYKELGNKTIVEKFSK
jgi:hypothetical protein